MGHSGKQAKSVGSQVESKFIIAQYHKAALEGSTCNRYRTWATLAKHTKRKKKEKKNK